ncbi:peptidylprolyl isomerase [Pelagibacteraceae bacterium]|nr:peptidylprolyl isomerase [Pelagibacteraceae bacterium]
MLKIKQIFIVIFLTLQSDYLFTKINNSIIVKVGNEIITALDVENEIKTILVLKKLDFTQENINRSKDFAIKTLIKSSIKESEIKKYGIEKFNPNDSDKYLAKIAESLNIKRTELKEFFFSKNLDYNSFKKRYEIELKWNTLIFNIYKNQISLNTIEIENELKTRLSSSTEKDDYNLSEIEIDITQDVEDKIKEVYKTINELGFAKAAYKLSISSSSSQGGNMGWISSKALNNSILKSIVKLEIGTVTKPIKQTTSILILKINDKKNYKTERQDVDKLKDLIVRQKKEEKLKLFSRSHFASIESNILINFE